MAWDYGVPAQKFPEAEFKEFKPHRWTAKNRFHLSAGLNLKTLNTMSSETNHVWALSQILAAAQILKIWPQIPLPEVHLMYMDSTINLFFVGWTPVLALLCISGWYHQVWIFNLYTSLAGSLENKIVYKWYISRYSPELEICWSFLFSFWGLHICVYFNFINQKAKRKFK